LWALPTVALLAHEPIARVKLSEFGLYFAPVILVSSLMWCETRSWFQPGGVKLSWRGILLGIARWPVILWALVNVVLRIKRPYMITPKDVSAVGPRSITLYGSAVALALVPLVAVLVFHATTAGSAVRGYYGLALINAALGLGLLAMTLSLEIGQSADRLGIVDALRPRAGTVAVTIGLFALLAFSTMTVWHSMASVVQ
jgi:cellulose synthase (UDP-forming)